MKRPEPFLTRWSRLKRKESAAEAVTDHPAAAEASSHDPAALELTAPTQPRPEAEPGPRDQPIDLPALPDIDSITAGSDIRAFLRSGVPVELTKAALRRAWTTDPAIRDFVGIAENQWDFTDPGAIPGFGPLAGEDAAGLLRQALGQAVTPPPAPASAMGPSATKAREPAGQVHGIPDRNAGDGAPRAAVEGQQKVALAATQHPAPPADAVRPPSRRTHGSARPK